MKHPNFDVRPVMSNGAAIARFWVCVLLFATVALNSCGGLGIPQLDSGSSAGAPKDLRFGIASTGQSITAITQDNLFWYVIGNFTRVRQELATKFLTLLPSGEVGNRCPTQRIIGDVNAIAYSSDSIYLGGSFSKIGTQSVFSLAKISKQDCTLDTTFSPASANGFAGSVRALLVDGGSIFVGGDFTSYRRVALSANSLAKLDLMTGAIDTTFSPVGSNANGFNGSVSSLAVNGTSLYVAGSFSAYKGVSGSAMRLAKLDSATGALDTTFSPNGSTANGFNDLASSLAISGPSLYVGGAFTAYKNVANSANRLAKLDLTTGALDTTFSPFGPSANGFNGFVSALIAVGPSLYVGGQFSAYKGVTASANYLAKLDLMTGALDATFSPVGTNLNGFSSTVNAFASDGAALFVGGAFSAYKSAAVKSIAKLDLVNGILDSSFGQTSAGPARFDSSVNTMAFDGTSLYVGGAFSSYGGQVANNIAKFRKSDLTLDTTFSPQDGPNGFTESVPRSISLYPDSLVVNMGDTPVYAKYRDNYVNGDFVQIDKATGAQIP